MEKKGTLPYQQVTSGALRTATKRWSVLRALALATLGLYLCNAWSGHDNRKKHHHQRLFGKKAEEVFLTIPDETSAIATSRLFATKPHLAGSQGDLDTAKDFLTLFQQEFMIKPPIEEPIFAAGSAQSQDATHSISTTHKPQAWIDTYYPVMNTPLERSLQVLAADGTVLWDADLLEYSDDTDPEAAKYTDAVPTFHGLSPGGDVSGTFVNGGYCQKEDYDGLVNEGADLNGKIVLCRYGGIFRGLKVKGGQDLGASGVLIYSDPRDDGLVTVENGYTPYPHGPARNPTSVQRGSVQFLSVYPGDPTTPGYPSYENSTRTEGSNIPKIPSLPISWANAEVLLSNLGPGGKWEGSRLRLLNQVDTKVTPIWNTMGVIPGYIKDEVVFIGNHRDAWVMGATDPSSGTVSVHEVVRGFGALYRKGWRPLRTIVIATWDAEEYGLIGSTEWGEDFSQWIIDNVVTYLNLDSSVSGSRLGVSGSPLLSHLIRQSAEELPHPSDNERSLWDATRDVGNLRGNRTDGRVIQDMQAAAVRGLEISTADSIGVSPLGSGSDYTVFLQRLGIPSTNGGFGSTAQDPAYHYHSVFDSERWQEIYGDPGFYRHVAAAKHLGVQALRLSSAIVLPFNTTHYAYELEGYLDQVEAIVSTQALELDLQPLRDSMHALRAASISLDSEKAAAEENLRKVVAKTHSAILRAKRSLRRAYCRLRKALGHKCKCPHQKHRNASSSPTAYTDAIVDYLAVAGWDGSSLSGHPPHGRLLRDLRRAIKRVRAVNKKLRSFERGFISTDGIKDREWFKHLGVAPGKWLGYGATTLPGLTESLTFDHNVALARFEAQRVQVLIDDLVKTIQVEKSV